jgi:predicted adenine nucleotide alpha hydrolase (AANH) superfamily ATPase
MHICCANCALYPIKILRQKDYEVQGFWFNPNIHPLLEYRSRLAALRQLESLWDIPIEYRDEYGLIEFVRRVVHHEESRCEYCYAVRLDAAAQRAKELGMDAFTTSLLVSPYQKFDIIQSIGHTVSERHGIAFYAEDFRSGYSEGTRLSRQMGLYRQKYCGCVYSEMQRYL